MRPSNKKVVLLLDRNYYPIKAIPWRRAMGKLHGGEMKAEVICMYTDAVGDFDPAVIRLMHRSLPPHQMRRRPRLTRRTLFTRDNHECQYCSSKKDLTIDHVIPRSRGGRHSFDNCTTACLNCNQAKADMTPEEWGVLPKNKPSTPIMGIVVNPQRAPDEWQNFLY